MWYRSVGKNLQGTLREKLKKVKLKEGYNVMFPAKAMEMVDENTICVVVILSSTLTGEFEDVKLLNELLTKKNKETGWDTPIHVDAASGGFIAPFLWPNLEWNFRLPLVKSINVSGHKYGLVYAGVGGLIWRSKDDLPDELVFHINYLGSDQPTFTLNFSKGSYQIIDPKFYFSTIKKASRLMNKFGSWPRISCHANTIYGISEFGTVYTIYVDIFE